MKFQLSAIKNVPVKLEMKRYSFTSAESSDLLCWRPLRKQAIPTLSVISEKMGSKAALEGIVAYHTVCHNYSIRSLDWTPKLLQLTFKPKFTLCSPCILIWKNIRFCSIVTNTSNHKETKVFPVLVTYIDWNQDVKVKILKINHYQVKYQAL